MEVRIFKVVVANIKVKPAISVALQVPCYPRDLTDTLVVLCR